MHTTSLVTVGRLCFSLWDREGPALQCPWPNSLLRWLPDEIDTVLGVLLGDRFFFASFLYSIVCKSRAIFLEMLHAGETSGFAFPVLASQVPVRIEQFILYGAAFLAAAPNAGAVLNR